MSISTSQSTIAERGAWDHDEGHTRERLRALNTRSVKSLRPLALIQLTQSIARNVLCISPVCRGVTESYELPNAAAEGLSYPENCKS